MFVDSHCHLNMVVPSLDSKEMQAVLDQAKLAGVNHFLCVAVTLNDHEALTHLAETYPNIAISAGLHPNEDPGVVYNESLLNEQAKHNKVVAIGETGLDYYRSEGDLTWQRDRFISHIHCAKITQKPLIIHMREAIDDTLQIMKSEEAGSVGGVMHCFTENWETAKRALDLNFYISFSGIVTFKSAVALQEVAKNLPLDRMLIETDSPYLAPIPHRGKPNVPAYVRHVAEFIAELRGVAVEEIAQRTTENFFSLFKLASHLSL
jgi:TatD DNase family protein